MHLPNALCRTFAPFLSPHPAGHNTGGLVVLVRRAWLADGDLVVDYVSPGRILVLHFTWPHELKLRVVLCHITSERTATWRSNA
eukprot:5458609-Amphidinium_carterae.1